MGIKNTVNKQLVAQRFKAARPTYDAEAKVQFHIAERLSRELDLFYPGKHFESVLEVGCGTGVLTARLDSTLDIEKWTFNDLDESLPLNSNICLRNPHRICYISGDAEQIDLGRGYDMIVSASTMQWFTQPKLFLQSLPGRLNKQGILLISTFGKNNLHEVRTLTGHGLQYCGVEDLHKWLSMSFSRVKVLEEHVTFAFETGRQVLEHLKKTGVGAAPGPQERWTPGRMKRFCKDYAEIYGTDAGFLPLTYHPVYLLAQL
ncbi:hypothetical protein HR11_01885 [Porphyromonas macacae]|uniref:malonyl-ACP O-methyltransferase BioC n=1 Tax=Porphyromonas macacae TaxID=28115 RepID=UPI00052C57CA|nr:malonyl-ACP O-methyltransferase BioC [Porphyromonas macacae]KGO00624.1 hypothetical protein HR11_01885 [Porphyromonas macacae]